ncbi:unnamed protein product [Rotaria socialis]|uniref:Uncharacterized protein n=2 Tax=Rotaria socialis TaxID=392032 RepID=A0A818EGY8_9BILA|nr:unnamed protein product [Rotaria socialis]
MNFFARCSFVAFCIFVAENNLSKALADQRGHVRETRKQYQCIAHCMFSASFDELSSFVLPQQCQTRVQNSVCHIELNVDFEARRVSVVFDYHGDHADMSTDIDLKSDMEMEVREASFNFQRNKISKATWINFCTTSDECDKRYMDSQISHIAKNDKWPIFDNISSLIYSSSSENLQCHLDGILKVCPNQHVCGYTLSPQSNNGKPEYTCQPKPADGQMIFFQTHRSKTTPSLSADLNKYDILNYTCNVDNCNSPTISTEIRRILNFEVEVFIINSSHSILFGTKAFLFLFYASIFVVIA